MNTHMAYSSAPTPQDVITTRRPVVRDTADRLLRDSAYLLVSWPVLLSGFIATIILLTLGAGLTVLVVGVPILVAGLSIARGLADAERGLQRGLLGRELPPSLPDSATVSGTPWQRVAAMARNPQRLGDALFALAGWLFATVSWSVALSVWLVIIAGLTSAVWYPALSWRGSTGGGIADLMGVGHLPWMHVLSNTIVGLVLLLLAPKIMRGLAETQSRINASLMFGPTRTARVELEHRARMEATRAAEARSLQQLERDIHDGPQQRLVRLQMDLARASRQWDRDPVAARGAMEAATQQAQDALNDLRAATRGVAPPILVDRGLVAGLDELAGRSAVPTTLHFDLPRLNPGYETALYFGVTEALTNAAKHANATHVEVRCFVDGPWAVAEIRDDGDGGAHLGKGTGLAGLERRMTGLGGRLHVDSPVGGPTLIRVEVPCVS